jgi:hypothetical protein
MSKRDKRAAHFERELRTRQQKLRREANAVAFVPVQHETVEELIARHANRPNTPVKGLREIMAENQEQSWRQLLQLQVWLSAFGWHSDAGHFAMLANNHWQNAWRLRNPEPMMEAVHRFWLDSQKRK